MSVVILKSGKELRRRCRSGLERGQVMMGSCSPAREETDRRRDCAGGGNGGRRVLLEVGRR